MIQKQRCLPKSAAAIASAATQETSRSANVSAMKKPLVVKGVIDLSGSIPTASENTNQERKSSPVVKQVSSLTATEQQNNAPLNQKQKGRYVVEQLPSLTDTQEQINALGRTLAGILRHRAEDFGLKIRDDGYCKVSDILKLNKRTFARVPLRQYSVDDVLKAVEHDLKSRFSVMEDNGILYIRANQGHSMKVIDSDKLLKEVSSEEEIPVCIHGTYICNLSSIMQTGLSTMGRNHIHFATGLPKDKGVISGMRSSCEVLIYLNVKDAIKDGMKFYISENQVVLTGGFGGVIPPKYFSKVIAWPSRKLLHVT